MNISIKTNIKTNIGIVLFLTCILSAFFGPELSVYAENPIDEQSLLLTNARARETAAVGATGGGFITITNKTPTSVRLVKAECALCKRVEIHEMKMENGNAFMRELSDGIRIDAGQSVDLKPGGLHLMLIGLSKRLYKGKTVRVTLHFKLDSNTDMYKRDVDFKVVASGSG